jgi:hypothetical protein
MHSNARKTGLWGLRLLFKRQRRLALAPPTFSTRAMHATRRRLLRKLSRHFAQERAAQG